MEVRLVTIYTVMKKKINYQSYKALVIQKLKPRDYTEYNNASGFKIS